jgi:hypothetical protein
VSTADRLVLTLQRLYTFTTARVKVLTNFEPNHAMLVKHHTTLLRCDCIETQQSLYKDMQKHQQPTTVTAQSGPQPSLVVSTLEKAATPKELGYNPATPSPLCSFLIRSSVQSHT